jgi:dimethylhistidine N-methyltransferase
MTAVAAQRADILHFPGIAAAGSEDFLQDVLEGMSREQRSIPCKYLYDERGSELFDSICELPEYYPTRTETALTRDSAGAIASRIGADATLFEPGAGASVKVRSLLDALERPYAYHPIDISGEHLQANVRRLARDYPETAIIPVVADFTRAYEIPLPAEGRGRRVVYFPGSTIGNFEPQEATRLLKSFAAPLRRGDFVLLGWDRFKDGNTLVPAYDDAAGVTADFIGNLLHRMRRDLGAALNPDGFELWTRWQPEQERIRISLRAKDAQRIELAGHRFDFSTGEELFVEHSHKYRVTTMEKIVNAAGLRMVEDWTDSRDWFSLSLLTVS